MFASTDVFVAVGGSVYVLYRAGARLLPEHVGLAQVPASFVNGGWAPT